MKFRTLIAFVLGVLCGMVASVALLLAINSYFMKSNDNVSRYWNREGKSPQEYQALLSACGREILLGEAFARATRGTDKAEIFKVFGPPDIELTGSDLERYRANHHGSATVAIYKVGRCGFISPFYFQVFIIDFDQSEKLRNAMEQGLADGHPWSK